MTTPRALVKRLVREEHGYSLIELLTVMAILGVILGALTTVFIQASNAQTDMNRRFQAQQHARLGLEKLRREVHCASGITPASTTTNAIILTLGASCPGGPTTVTWCTRSVSGSTTRYALFRVSASGCGTGGGKQYADYLLTPAGSCAGCLFRYTPQSTTSLGKLHVDLPVDLTPTRPPRAYQLSDDIALRNSARS